MPHLSKNYVDFFKETEEERVERFARRAQEWIAKNKGKEMPDDKVIKIKNGGVKIIYDD